MINGELKIISKNKKFFLSVITGNILEYYDIGLYLYLLPKLTVVFFPKNDPQTEMLVGLMVFAAGFVMRPLGGILFGHIGDRYGRKKMLILSISLSAIPAFVIGCLPSFDTIGMSAYVILILCRVAHGVCVGGESAAILVYILEKTQKKKENFIGSVIGSIATIGVIIGGLCSMLSLHHSAPSWGWRVPFLLSIILGLYGGYYRYHLQESKAFQLIKKTPRPPPLIEVFKKNKKSMLCVFGVAIAASIPIHLMTVYVSFIMINFMDVKTSKAIFFNMIILLSQAAILPLCGILADKIGNPRLMKVGLISMTVAAYPVFYMISLKSLGWVIGGQLLLIAVYSLFQCGIGAFNMHRFPVPTRATGIGFAFNLGNSLIGSTAPLVVTFFSAEAAYPIIPTIYIFIGAAIGWFSIWLSENDRYYKISSSK